MMSRFEMKDENPTILDSDNLVLCHFPTHNMVADLLTKPLSKPQFQRLQLKLELETVTTSSWGVCWTIDFNTQVCTCFRYGQNQAVTDWMRAEGVVTFIRRKMVFDEWSCEEVA